MAYIMTTEAEIQQKAGAGVNAAFNTAMMTAAAIQMESMINVMCKYNFSDLVTAGLNVDVKGLLSDIVSSYVAIQAISYDMSGYTSRVEAEDMINVLRDGMLRGLGILRQQSAQDFIVTTGA